MIFTMREITPHIFMEQSEPTSTFELEGPRPDVQQTFERLWYEGATISKGVAQVRGDKEGEMRLVIDMQAGATALQIQSFVAQLNDTVGVSDYKPTVTESATVTDERV